MKIEYELRILNIDKAGLVQRLEKVGARKIHDEVLQRRYIMDFPDDRLQSHNAWLRLRTVGGHKVECTLKQRLDNQSIRNAQEIEIEISDFETARELFEGLGLEVKKYQENKRLRYHKNGVVFDIDTQPGCRPYMEIESDGEDAIWSAVKELGYQPSDCTFLAGRKLLEHLGLTLEQQKNLRFTSHEDNS